MSSRKKKSIIIGYAIGGVAVIALSVELGVGLTQCNKKDYVTYKELKVGQIISKISFVKDVSGINNNDLNNNICGIGFAQHDLQLIEGIGEVLWADLCLYNKGWAQSDSVYGWDTTTLTTDCTQTIYWKMANYSFAITFKSPGWNNGHSPLQLAHYTIL